MRRRLVAATAAGALAVSACGAEVASVVETAFEQDIKSANVTVDVSVQASGQELGLMLSGPVRGA